MRFLLLALVAVPALAVPVAIVAPLPGAPAVGERVIEVESDLEAVDRVEIRVDGRLAGVLRTPPFRLPFDFGTGGQPHRIEVEVFAGGYAERHRTELVTAGIEEAHVVDFVEVPVRLRSPRNPTAGDFTIVEDGIAHVPRDVRPERGPTRFVFVVDRSHSMRGAPIEAALEAVRETAGRLREGDTAEVLFFNHRVARPVAIGAANATASGGTAVRDALASIGPSGRTVAIVISDGADRNSLIGPEDAVQAVAVRPLAVHALVLGGGKGATFLKDVAARTGGSFRSTTPRRLGRDLGSVLDDIDSRWTLAYQSLNHGRGWRTIEVRPTRPGIVAAGARAGYFAE